jgi:hypothetical protein
MKKSIALLAIAFSIFFTTELKANHYPGYIEIFDRITNIHWGDNLYLNIFGQRINFNPNRASGEWVQKFPFTITKSGYVNYTIEGNTVYNNGTVACCYGSGKIWVDAGSYFKFEIVDTGWNAWTNCRQLQLQRR